MGFNIVRDIIGALAKKGDRSVGEKGLNISPFGLIEEGAVKRTRNNIIRLAVVLTTMVAWFSISNHCAAGALEGRQSEAVHASCHESAPAPTHTPMKDEQPPCCKVLRATLVTIAKSFVGYDASMSSLNPYFVAPIAFPEPFPANVSFELDTGPPLARSFAESVLQRSILAHAPPFSLS